LEFAAKAEALWRDELYAELTRPRAGAFGAATDRAAPQVLRLALISVALSLAALVGSELLARRAGRGVHVL
jgi:molybdate transport system permease protein